MIRVEVIPPEFDLSRPVKGEKALLVESIGDIFTGKNQRSKSRHTRSIVGQRGSGDADGKTKLIFELANGGNKISGFFTAFGFLRSRLLEKCGYKNTAASTFVAICITVASGAPRAQPTPRF